MDPLDAQKNANTLYTVFRKFQYRLIKYSQHNMHVTTYNSQTQHNKHNFE